MVRIGTNPYRNSNINHQIALAMVKVKLNTGDRNGTMNLEHVKVGDWVWEGSQPLGQFFPKQRMCEVVAVTPKGFRVQGGGKDLFKKATGRAWQGSTRKFHAIATPAEVEHWKAQQETLRLERERQDSENARRKALCAELRELFADVSTALAGELTNRVYVEDAKWGNSTERTNKLDLSFHNLTEQQIRSLAQVLRKTEILNEHQA